MKKPIIITDEEIRALDLLCNYNPKGLGTGLTVREGMVELHDTYGSMWYNPKYVQEVIYWNRVLSEEDMRTVIYYIYQKYGFLKNTGFGLDCL